MHSFNHRQTIVALVIAFATVGSSCSKFSGREMYTGGDTNIGSGTPGPGDEPPGENCGQAIITWNKNKEADLAGYRLYYSIGTSSNSTQIQITDLSKDSVSVKGLTKNLTYNFKMTAYDKIGQESVPSAVISKKIDKCPVKKLSLSDLKEKLTPLQFEVTQNAALEPAFENAYWNNSEKGIYVDITSGEPLFSSLDQFDSKLGWPAFKKPLIKENIVLKKTERILKAHSEVRSLLGDSHLGYIFPDATQTEGQFYSINSAALRFIPKDELTESGYGEFNYLFESSAQ